MSLQCILSFDHIYLFYPPLTPSLLSPNSYLFPSVLLIYM